MDRIRRLIGRPSAYEPIEDRVQEDILDGQPRFSRVVYAIFFLLGISMLWAWNMFLAAAPYFLSRFQSDEWAATHYQSSILTVSTITNLGAVWILAKIQENASYPKRIKVSLLINTVVFTLLAFSTVLLKDVTVKAYFGFLMLMVFGASLATGINQNGTYAYVSGFGREEYTQAIMGGQGVAGVLPCIVQIISVLAVPTKTSTEQQVPQESPKSAFFYFITATIISCLGLVAFLYLDNKQAGIIPGFPGDETEESIAEPSHIKPVGLWTLCKKLRYNAFAVFLCFTVTMFFPVFTAKINSVNEGPGHSRIFEPTVFTPLAMLFWNLGDLLGRMSVLIPSFSLAHRPKALAVVSILRIGFIPLYLLCNIHGNGAVVKSDFFYLVVVQLLFGFTNGNLGSGCMVGAGNFVDEDEREPAGGFMSFMLVGGLAAGSILSFFVRG